MRKLFLLSCTALALTTLANSERLRVIAQTSSPSTTSAAGNTVVDLKTYQDLRWRSVGPHRGGRSTAAAGVRTQPNVFYMGATGGGVWKTENYGITWTPITDGQIATGSIGAIDVVRFEPERHLRRHRQRGDPLERDPRPRRLQVDRRRQDVAVTPA